jgi:hypothetical protein
MLVLAGSAVSVVPGPVPVAGVILAIAGGCTNVSVDGLSSPYYQGGCCCS